jgi:hypothetical protein
MHNTSTNVFCLRKKGKEKNEGSQQKCNVILHKPSLPLILRSHTHPYGKHGQMQCYFKGRTSSLLNEFRLIKNFVVFVNVCAIHSIKTFATCLLQFYFIIQICAAYLPTLPQIP